MVLRFLEIPEKHLRWSDLQNPKTLYLDVQQGSEYSSEYTSTFHCVQVVRIRSFSGLYFPAFGLSTKRYSVSLCIQSKCGKIRARKTPNMDTFDAVCAFRYIYFIF